MTYEQLLELAKAHTAEVKSVLLALLDCPTTELEEQLAALHKKDKVIAELAMIFVQEERERHSITYAQSSSTTKN